MAEFKTEKLRNPVFHQWHGDEWWESQSVASVSPLPKAILTFLPHRAVKWDGRW